MVLVVDPLRGRFVPWALTVGDGPVSKHQFSIFSQKLQIRNKTLKKIQFV